MSMRIDIRACLKEDRQKGGQGAGLCKSVFHTAQTPWLCWAGHTEPILKSCRCGHSSYLQVSRPPPAPVKHFSVASGFGSEQRKHLLSRPIKMCLICGWTSLAAGEQECCQMSPFVSQKLNEYLHMLEPATWASQGRLEMAPKSHHPFLQHRADVHLGWCFLVLQASSYLSFSWTTWNILSNKLPFC